MYCKLIASILTIFGGMAIGCSIAVAMRRRIDNLKEIHRIINYIQGEIVYRHCLLGEALIKTSGKCSHVFSVWLKSLGEKLLIMESEETGDSFIDMWKGSLNYLKENTRLGKEDIKALILVGQAFDGVDIATMQMSLELEKENLQNQISDMEKNVRNKSKLAIMFGTLMGMLLVVILI